MIFLFPFERIVSLDGDKKRIELEKKDETIISENIDTVSIVKIESFIEIVDRELKELLNNFTSLYFLTFIVWVFFNEQEPNITNKITNIFFFIKLKKGGFLKPSLNFSYSSTPKYLVPSV